MRGPWFSGFKALLYGRPRGEARAIIKPYNYKDLYILKTLAKAVHGFKHVRRTVKVHFSPQGHLGCYRAWVHRSWLVANRACARHSAINNTRCCLNTVRDQRLQKALPAVRSHAVVPLAYLNDLNGDLHLPLHIRPEVRRLPLPGFQ